MDIKVLVLKRCFDGFADEEGAIPADNVGSILSMMGMKVKPSALRYMSSLLFVSTCSR